MTRVDLHREGVRTFADLAVVGAVLVFVAQILGPARGVASSLVQVAAVILAAAVLAGPLVAIKLRAIERASSPVGGATKALLKLVQIGGYACLWGAVAVTSDLLSSTGLAD